MRPMPRRLPAERFGPTKDLNPTPLDAGGRRSYCMEAWHSTVTNRGGARASLAHVPNCRRGSVSLLIQSPQRRGGEGFLEQ